MFVTTPSFRPYHWGSKNKLQEFFELPVDGEPLAEAWFGTHRTSGSEVSISSKKTIQLNDFVMGNVDKHLGPVSLRKFGRELPFLMKLLAVRESLSIQVHPDAKQAKAGFAEEEKLDIKIANPARSFKDPNPKPEMFVALQKSYMFNGFLPADEILVGLENLEGSLIKQVAKILTKQTDEKGVKAAFELIINSRKLKDSETGLRKSLDSINVRVDSDLSSNLLQDKLIQLVAQDHPEDPMLLTLLLMNAFEMDLFDGAFVPEGRVHLYVRAYGLEVMINSDNVLRAGLTKKHVNEPLFLEIAHFSPVGRLAPTRANIDNHLFDYRGIADKRLGLNIGQLSENDEKIEVYPQGPRILLCLDGEIIISDSKSELPLKKAQAAFISDIDGLVTVKGKGLFALSYVDLD